MNSDKQRDVPIEFTHSLRQENIDYSKGFRIRRIKYAVVTSLCSKAITIIMQVVALPIAVKALGNKQFVLYSMLISAVGWLSLVNLGIGPALTVNIAEAAVLKDRETEKRLFNSAAGANSGIIAHMNCT